MQGGKSLAPHGRWPKGGVSGTDDPVASVASLLSVAVASSSAFMILVEKRQIASAFSL